MQGARQSDVFFGERESGQDVRTSNATAVQAVANIVKSSLGPVGLDKVRFLSRLLCVFWKKKSTAIVSSSSSRFSFVSNGIDFVRARTDEHSLLIACVLFCILLLNRCSWTISAT
jgi:RNase P/RNase MRP subunit POP5